MLGRSVSTMGVEEVGISSQHTATSMPLAPPVHLRSVSLFLFVLKIVAPCCLIHRIRMIEWGKGGGGGVSLEHCYHYEMFMTLKNLVVQLGC
jgi:hypothetical protein